MSKVLKKLQITEAKSPTGFGEARRHISLIGSERDEEMADEVASVITALTKTAQADSISELGTV